MSAVSLIYSCPCLEYYRKSPECERHVACQDKVGLSKPHGIHWYQYPIIVSTPVPHSQDANIA